MEKFTAAGTDVWAVSPELQHKLAKYAAKEGIKYSLLSDPDLQVISSWGLANPDRPSVPDPTAVVIDSTGTVRYLRRDHDYKQRPPAAELLAAISGLEISGRPVGDG